MLEVDTDGELNSNFDSEGRDLLERGLIDVGTGWHWGHVPPPRFCNKQRSGLFILENGPLFGKSALKASCPQV